MIHVSRSPTPPAELTSPDAERARSEADRFFTGQSQAVQAQLVFSFDPSVYAAPAVVRALDLLFHGKWAWCETLVCEPSEFNVDHYRPREGALGLDGSYDRAHYHWLAYEWENLYLTCPDCLTLRGSRFPVKGRRARGAGPAGHHLQGFRLHAPGAAWFQRRRRWTGRPALGHIVFFNFPRDGVNRISHVGIVESVRPDGSIVTIEGNTDERGGRTGGKVMRKVRRVGIVGYGIPDYDDNGSRKRSGFPSWPGTLLKAGSRGPDVNLVQGRLVQLKVARLAIDGEFGPMTEAAVKKFQKAKGLEVDGIVGPQAWKTLGSP